MGEVGEGSNRARWMKAVTPVKVSDDHERIFEKWGKSETCTQWRWGVGVGGQI